MKVYLFNYSLFILFLDDDGDDEALGFEPPKKKRRLNLDASSSNSQEYYSVSGSQWSSGFFTKEIQ